MAWWSVRLAIVAMVGGCSFSGAAPTDADAAPDAPPRVDTDAMIPDAMPMGMQTATFEEGVDGYIDTIDTYIDGDDRDAIHGGLTLIDVDSNDPITWGFIRFQRLFVAGGGPIPDNATILDARLTIEIVDPGFAVNVYDVLIPWDESFTWNDVTMPLNGPLPSIDYQIPRIHEIPANQTGTHTFSVLSSALRWATNPNYGWIFEGGGNGIQFSSADGTNPPILEIDYEIP